MIHQGLFVYSVGVSHAAFSQPASKEAQLQKAMPLDQRDLQHQQLKPQG